MTMKLLLYTKLSLATTILYNTTLFPYILPLMRPVSLTRVNLTTSKLFMRQEFLIKANHITTRVQHHTREAIHQLNTAILRPRFKKVTTLKLTRTMRVITTRCILTQKTYTKT